jgi:hypothetical protein
MTEGLIVEQLKNLLIRFVQGNEKASKDLDRYCEERSRILAKSPKFLSWEATLQSDLWRLRNAVDSISQAYEEWKKGDTHYIGRWEIEESFWDPASLTLEEYRDTLFKLVESSIIAKKIPAIPMPEETDYWVIPIDLLILCHNKNVVLPAPYFNFLFSQSIESEFTALDLKLTKEAYDSALRKSNRRPDIRSLFEKRESCMRRDQDQMEEFLRVAKKIWGKLTQSGKPIDKSNLLKHPEIVRAREQFTDANGKRKILSDGYLKRVMSKIAPNAEARKGGRRRYAKS